MKTDVREEKVPSTMCGIAGSAVSKTEKRCCAVPGKRNERRTFPSHPQKRQVGGSMSNRNVVTRASGHDGINTCPPSKVMRYGLDRRREQITSLLKKKRDKSMNHCLGEYKVPRPVSGGV